MPRASWRFGTHGRPPRRPRARCCQCARESRRQAHCSSRFAGTTHALPASFYEAPSPARRPGLRLLRSVPPCSVATSPAVPHIPSLRIRRGVISMPEPPPRISVQARARFCYSAPLLSHFAGRLCILSLTTIAASQCVEGSDVRRSNHRRQRGASAIKGGG